MSGGAFGAAGFGSSSGIPVGLVSNMAGTGSFTGDATSSLTASVSFGGSSDFTLPPEQIHQVEASTLMAGGASLFADVVAVHQLNTSMTAAGNSGLIPSGIRRLQISTPFPGDSALTSTSTFHVPIGANFTSSSTFAAFPEGIRIAGTWIGQSTFDVAAHVQQGLGIEMEGQSDLVFEAGGTVLILNPDGTPLPENAKPETEQTSEFRQVPSADRSASFSILPRNREEER